MLASGFVRSNPTAPPAQLVELWNAGAYSLAVSQHIITELDRTFAQPYFQQRLTPEEIANALAALHTDAQFTALTVSVSGVATHLEDDLVLATALSAGADFLVTGDAKVQAIGNYQGVTVVSPRAFLQIVQAQTTILPGGS